MDIEVSFMDPCELTLGATALANAVAARLDSDELDTLVVFLCQFKDTLTSIIVQRAINRRFDENDGSC